MAGKKKRPTTKTRPNRNSLCPCGSGRAFKNCCAGKRQATPDKPDSVANQVKRMIFGLAVFALIAGGLALAVVRPWENASRQPFEYDAENDRYWSSEHDHWHDGRPPSGGEGSSSRSTSPEPWEYDDARDRYWDRSHGHWHDGRPPAPAQR